MCRLPLQRLVPLACLLVMAGMVGCNRYGDLSPLGYGYAKALYSIANRHAPDKLEDIDRRISRDVDAGRVTQREANYLQPVVAMCRRGEWDAAVRRSRSILESQARPR